MLNPLWSPEHWALGEDRGRWDKDLILSSKSLGEGLGGQSTPRKGMGEEDLSSESMGQERICSLVSRVQLPHLSL